MRQKLVGSDSTVKLVRRKWPLVFKVGLVTAMLCTLLLSVGLYRIEKYPFLILTVFVFGALLLYPVVDLSTESFISAPSVRFICGCHFTLVAATLLVVRFTGFSVAAYVSFALAVTAAAAVAIHERTTPMYRFAVIASTVLVVGVAGQIAFPAGIWDPDTRGVHVPLAEFIVRTGHVTFEERLLFPLHHVQVAEFMLISQLGGYASYVTIAIAMAVGMILTVYRLARSFVGPPAATLAALVPPAADYSHYMFTHPGKMIFGYSMLLSVALFFFVKYQQRGSKYRPRWVVLFLCIISGIVIIHPFSAAVTAVIMMSLAVVSRDNRLYLGAAAVGVSIFGYFVTAGFPTWTVFIGGAVSDVAALFVDSASSGGGGPVQEATRFATIPIFELAFQTIGQGLLLAGVVWGGLYVANRVDRLWRLRIPVAVTGLVILIALFGSLLSLFYVLPQRWYLLGYLFGLNILFGITISRIGQRKALALVFLLALLAPMSAIAGFSTAMFYSQTFYKSYGTEYETAAQEWRMEYNVTAVGPHGYQNSGDTQNLYTKTGRIRVGRIPPDAILLYDEEYERTGVSVGGSAMVFGQNRGYIRPTSAGLDSRASKIYTSGAVRGYIPTR